MLSKVEFDDENEKDYYESKTMKTNTKKDELIEMYGEIQSKLILFSNLEV